MTREKLKLLGVGFVFLWFFSGGLGHFVFTDFFAGIMPDYIDLSLHYPAVYISGIIEITLALLLLNRSSRRLAGWGLILLTLAVSPANIYMWMHPERFPDVPEAALTARLVIQIGLLALIGWSTRPTISSQENQAAVRAT